MSIKNTVAKAAATAKTLKTALKTADPLNLSKISRKKPKAGKIRMGPTKITSTLPMKGGKPVARAYGTPKVTNR